MEPLLGRGVTVSYNKLSNPTDAVKQVYDLHINTLVKFLLSSSIFLLLFFIVIGISAIWYISLWDLNYITSLVVAFVALLIAIPGVPISILGIRVARLQSRRSSKIFSKVFSVFFGFFMVFMALFLADHAY